MSESLNTVSESETGLRSHIFEAAKRLRPESVVIPFEKKEAIKRLDTQEGDAKKPESSTKFLPSQKTGEKVVDAIEKGVPTIMFFALLFVFIMLPALLTAVMGSAPLLSFGIPAFDLFGLSIPGFSLGLPKGPTWMAAILLIMSMLPTLISESRKRITAEGKKREEIRKKIKKGEIVEGDEEYDPKLDPKNHGDLAGGVGFRLGGRQAKAMWRILANPRTLIIGGSALALGLFTGVFSIPMITGFAGAVLIPWLQSIGILVGAGALFLTPGMLIGWGLVWEAQHGGQGFGKLVKTIGGLFIGGNKRKGNRVVSRVGVRRKEEDDKNN